jgi:hypothetical protein
MAVVLGFVVVGIAALGLFIMWFMLKGLQADFQWWKGDIQRYPKAKRKYLWAQGLAIPVCVGIGGLIGGIAGAGRSALGSSVKGDVIGGGVAYAVIIALVFLVGRPDSDAERQADPDRRKEMR